MLRIKGGGGTDRERNRMKSDALLLRFRVSPNSSPPPPTPTGNQDSFSGLLERGWREASSDLKAQCWRFRPACFGAPAAWRWHDPGCHVTTHGHLLLPGWPKGPEMVAHAMSVGQEVVILVTCNLESSGPPPDSGPGQNTERRWPQGMTGAHTS